MVRVSTNGIMVGYQGISDDDVLWEEICTSVPVVVNDITPVPVILCPIRVKEALYGIGAQEDIKVAVLQGVVAFIGDTVTHYIASTEEA